MPLMFGAAGPVAHNFLPEWVGKLTNGQQLKLFTDEFRTAVSAGAALDGLRIVVEQQISGIIHLGGRTRLSRYDFGKLLCDVWGFDPALLQPVQRIDVAFTAPRPADTFFDSSRAWAWGYASASLEDQLRTVMAEGHIS
jgi:dTDP-4-dehydrorhamnose reductase